MLKAVHGHLLEQGHHLGLVEIQREDFNDLPDVIYSCTDKSPFIIFCDELFEQDDISANHSKLCLKAACQVGLQILCFVTSNRRHLMPRQMIEMKEEQQLIHQRPQKRKSLYLTVLAYGLAFILSIRTPI